MKQLFAFMLGSLIGNVLIVILLLVAFANMGKAAGDNCIGLADTLAMLHQGEYREQSGGLTSGGLQIKVYTTVTGRWIALLFLEDNRVCLMESGKGWGDAL